MTNELAIPEPSSVIPPGFADRARVFFQQMTDIVAADDVRRRLAALEMYVRDKEMKQEAQSAARWGEVRIGELLGEPELGGRGKKLLNALNSLSPEERVWFRKMATHLAIVEDCLTGEIRRTSRTAILNEIARRLIAADPLALPDGTFRAIVIDPPWPMPKIERHERPRQDEEVDYPTMTLEEITALPVGDLAESTGAHIYLWVTHKFLPAGLDLLDAWGFNYQCVMTWRKNVGITPFSWMYDTEHVIFGRRGNLPLEQLGLRLSLDAPAIGHSIKPDAFYERVLAASPGPRLEMFARTRRDGFVPWGNEVPGVV